MKYHLFNLISTYKVLAFCGLSFLSIHLVFGNMRTFKNNEGNEIRAELIDYDEFKGVDMKMENGQVYKNISLLEFSLDDRSYIKSWAKKKRAALENADISIEDKFELTIYKGEDDEMNNYGDIDDRIVTFEPAVKIENQELEKSYKNLRGELAMIGANVTNKDEFCLLNKQVFKVNISHGSEIKWEGKSFRTRYDPDYGGFDYAGYVFVLKNKAGIPTHIKASKPIWEKYYMNVLKAQQFKAYDKNFTNERSSLTGLWINN